MLPLIREGDRLLVSHNLATMRRGSVVVFLKEGRLIAHRLLKIIPGSPSRFMTKGDNSWTFDETTTVDELIGHVLAVQGSDGRIALDSRKWRVVGWLIANATLAVAVPYGALRRVKQQRWGHQTLPGVRVLRGILQGVLRGILRPFIRSVAGANGATPRDSEHKTNLVPKINDAP
jgi:hypothetical protein